jgi:hypothetical protein
MDKPGKPLTGKHANLRKENKPENYAFTTHSNMI